MFLGGKPKQKAFHSLKSIIFGDGLTQNQVNVLWELKAFLEHWRTEPLDGSLFQNFFHIVDQLSFEMAVQGFIRKTDATLIRDFLQNLCKVGYNVPEVVRI